MSGRLVTEAAVNQTLVCMCVGCREAWTVGKRGRALFSIKALKRLRKTTLVPLSDSTDEENGT